MYFERINCEYFSMSVCGVDKHRFLCFLFLFYVVFLRRLL